MMLLADLSTFVPEGFRGDGWGGLSWDLWSNLISEGIGIVLGAGLLAFALDRIRVSAEDRRWSDARKGFFERGVLRTISTFFWHNRYVTQRLDTIDDFVTGIKSYISTPTFLSANQLEDLLSTTPDSDYADYFEANENWLANSVNVFSPKEINLIIKISEHLQKVMETAQHALWFIGSPNLELDQIVASSIDDGRVGVEENETEFADKPQDQLRRCRKMLHNMRIGVRTYVEHAGEWITTPDGFWSSRQMKRLARKYPIDREIQLSVTLSTNENAQNSKYSPISVLGNHSKQKAISVLERLDTVIKEIDQYFIDNGHSQDEKTANVQTLKTAETALILPARLNL